MGFKMYVDEQGVPYGNYGLYTGTDIGRRCSVLAVAERGLWYWNEFNLSGSGEQVLLSYDWTKWPINRERNPASGESARTMLFSCADWLMNNLTDRGSYLLWRYAYPFAYGVQAGWGSAQAQAVGIQLLLRASELTDGRYMAPVEGLLRAFDVPIEDGGLLDSSDPQTPWFEKFASPESQRPKVLNGMLFTLLALHDIAERTGLEAARRQYEVGLRSVLRLMERYDLGDWTAYDIQGKPASPHYHSIHVAQLDRLFTIEGDIRLAQWRDKFLSYQSPPSPKQGRVGPEADNLRKERDRLKSELEIVKNSLSYRLGSMLIQAVRRPGRNTILLPYRVFRLGVRTVRKKTSPSMPGTAAKKAYVLDMVRDRIDGIKQEMAGTGKLAAGPRRPDLRIAVIMDRFTYDCFKYEADLITFTQGNWKRVLSKQRPDLLFVESAWQGNDDSWRYQIVNLGREAGSRLPELVRWCKAQNIPTAFWCKEDPAHYDEFLDAARLFDYVFTTDADCIERYKKDLGHNNVSCLPFAVQPRIHNPVGSAEKIRDIAFAGSWYEGQNEFRMQRKEQMACILAPALSHDMDIYDRHYRLNEERFRFPEQYQPYIVGELPYEKMVYAYRMYRIFLNVNSVTDSRTMLPRRVLEILASGTSVLSGQSKAIANLLGPDIVPMSASAEETESLLNKLLEDKELTDSLALRGLRKVMREHTCEQRLDYIVDTVGMRQHFVGRKKGVSIVTCTNKPDYMDNIFANYDRQQYVDKELIIILNANSLDADEWMKEAGKHHNAVVYRIDEKEGLGACLNFGVDKARFDYIAKFDDDDYYAPAYLEDLMNAFDYSGADIVGKSAHYTYFERDNKLAIRFPHREHCFTRKVAGGTLVMKRRVFEKVRFDPEKGHGSDTRFQKECVRKGFRIYSADRFNFSAVRKAAPEAHTWKIADEEMMEASRIIAFTDDYVPLVTF